MLIIRMIIMKNRKIIRNSSISVAQHKGYIMNVLVVYNHDSTWVHDDIAILQRHYTVDTFFYKKDKKRKNLKELVKKSDVIFIWFASFHGLKAAYLADRFGKKIVTVASGYSVANLKEFDYGLGVHFYTRWIPKFILKRSDCVIAVSESNKNEILDLIDHHNNIQVIYHGFDTSQFKPNKDVLKKNMVITVASLDSVSIKRKGVDKFVSIAKEFPDCSFIVIGKKGDGSQKLISDATDNVSFPGFVTEEQLLRFYQQALVYAQFSFHEGFGCTVAEAMLCQCVPVVTDRGSLPEVVGNKGYIIPYWNEKKAVESVDSALHLSKDKLKEMRKRIVDEFSMAKREEKIVELMERL